MEILTYIIFLRFIYLYRISLHLILFQHKINTVNHEMNIQGIYLHMQWLNVVLMGECGLDGWMWSWWLNVVLGAGRGLECECNFDG